MSQVIDKRASPWTSRIAALAIGVGLGMAILVLPIWWNRIKTLDRFNDDFAAFYTAAKIDFAWLYNLDQQHAVQREFVSQPQPLLDFFYPPFFAVALKPLALLTYHNAFIAISTINLLFLALSLRLLVRKLKLDTREIGWLLLVAFTNFGLYVAFLKGQTAFMSLLLFVLFVMAVVDSEDPVMCKVRPSVAYRAGIWAGLLCFKPPLAVGPVIVLIAKRKWKSLVALLMTLAGLAGISLAAVGWNGIEGYLEISKRVGADSDYMDYAGLHDNIRAVIYSLISSNTIRTLVWAVASITLLWLIISYAKQRTSDPKRWTIILVAGLLVSPYLHGTDLTLLLVPTAFFLKWVGHEISPAAILMLMSPGILLTLQATSISLPPLAPISLIGFLIWIVQKENNPAKSPQHDSLVGS